MSPRPLPSATRPAAVSTPATVKQRDRSAKPSVWPGATPVSSPSRMSLSATTSGRRACTLAGRLALPDSIGHRHAQPRRDRFRRRHRHRRAHADACKATAVFPFPVSIQNGSASALSLAKTNCRHTDPFGREHLHRRHDQLARHAVRQRFARRYAGGRRRDTYRQRAQSPATPRFSRAASFRRAAPLPMPSARFPSAAVSPWRRAARPPGNQRGDPTNDR